MKDVLTAQNNNDAVSPRLLKRNTQKPSRTDDAALLSAVNVTTGVRWPCPLRSARSVFFIYIKSKISIYI